MSAVGRALDDYLQTRRSLGFKLREQGRLLADFVGYLDGIGAEHITVANALAWATAPPRGQSSYWGARLSVVRVFARWLHCLDPATEVPPPDLLPARSVRATPYLYSDAQITALIQAAGTIGSASRAATYQTLIGLLAVTGMRVGEAIGLDHGDVDHHQGLVIVRDGKFGKSRQLPVHLSALDALSAYQRLRDRHLPRRTPAFFVSLAGTRLIYQNVQSVFHRLVGLAGIRARSATSRPRIHDLRHTFAIQTLLDWYRDGQDVQARLPLLSTYLGHRSPTATYWYLQAVPELLALAMQRLETQPGGVA